MATFKALARGSQIVLIAGPLVFFSLFLTWQNVEVDYGPAGTATLSLDGWDAWGLVLALLALAVTTIVALQKLTETEMSDDISWPGVVFACGLVIFAVAVLKNLTDAGSSWASYGFVALAGVLAAGTYLDWAAARKNRSSMLAPRRRGLRPTA
jgi:hypothetical protein